MDRKEFESYIYDRNAGKTFIPDAEKQTYLKRLKTPYKSKKRTFYDQFIDGSGSELKSKFWNVASSSRFAFETYSWLANRADVKDIEFELKLVGIKNSSRGVPNMDVYIELDDRYIFIESKLTETYKQEISCSGYSLPGAYWKEKGDPEALTTGPRPVPLGSTLLQRYMNDSFALETFLEFIDDCTIKLAKTSGTETPKSWMEFGQEIKHLFGLYFYLKKHAQTHGKKAEFCNIYYDFEDPINAFVPEFFKNAEAMMNNLLDRFGIEFKYQYMSSQEVVVTFPDDAAAFASDQKVKDILKEKFLLK